MSSIPAIGAAGTSSRIDSVSLRDFLDILLAQLSAQDPLKPMDSKDFMAQLAQFTTLAQVQELNTRLDALLSTQASMQAVGLLGRNVEFDAGLGPTKGEVVSLSWAGSAPALGVETSDGRVTTVPLSQVTRIHSGNP